MGAEHVAFGNFIAILFSTTNFHISNIVTLCCYVYTSPSCECSVHVNYVYTKYIVYCLQIHVTKYLFILTSAILLLHLKDF